jgi:hypothetical protein
MYPCELVNLLKVMPVFTIFHIPLYSEYFR